MILYFLQPAIANMLPNELLRSLMTPQSRLRYQTASEISQKILGIVTPVYNGSFPLQLASFCRIFRLLAYRRTRYCDNVWDRLAVRLLTQKDSC